MTVDELVVKLLAYPGDSEVSLSGDTEFYGWLEVLAPGTTDLKTVFWSGQDD